MNTIPHHNTWSLLFLMLFICTNFAWGEPQEAIRKKEFNQSYAARPGNQLAIENKYGNITITHWQKDEIAIRVVVEAKARSEAQAQKMLERIDITLKKSGSVVLGATEIHASDGNNGSFSINYYVSMPTWIDLNLHQKYGNILLPKENNKGKCLLEVKYGNIEGGTFTQPLEVEAKYSNVSLGKLTTGNLLLGYSGKTTIAQAENLHIDSKYSNLEIGEVGTLMLDKKYGQIHIRKVNNLQVDMKYSNMTVEQLDRQLTCTELGYGNLDITKVASTFASIEVESHYGNLYLGIPLKASFKLKAEDMEYGDCEISSKFNKTHYEVNDDSAYYEVNHGRDGVIEFDGGGYGHITVGALE